MTKKGLIVIFISVLGGSMNITAGIIERNFYEFLLGIMAMTIALAVFTFEKCIKTRDDLIKLQDEYIEKQDKIMLDAFKELANPTLIIDMKNITIPEKFAKPRKEKLNSRIQYYNKNKCFEVPIIIDKDNMLVDGYTSYLIAKKYNMKTVQVKVKVSK